MNKEFYILRYERTEYAKRIRKDYESKRIKERRCNMRKWGIRHDGLCNTLSTVQKDNYLLEVTYKDDRDMNNSTIDFIKENNRNAKHQQDLLQHKDDVCRCVPAGTHGSTPHLTKTVVSDSPLRIRKLTPLAPTDNTIDAEKIKQVGQLYPNSGNPQAGRVYDADGISPAMDTCSGGNRMPKVAVAMRGRYNAEGELEQQLEISDREYANSITTVQKDSMVAEKEHP